jgi:hypothetical protein
MSTSNVASDTNTNTADNVGPERTEQPAQPTADEGEFQVTVRKLEMPVRPRGVLAE